MSEFANQRTRGAFIAGVFSMQWFGILFSSLVTMMVCSIFRVSADKLIAPFELPESKNNASVPAAHSHDRWNSSGDDLLSAMT